MLARTTRSTTAGLVGRSRDTSTYAGSPSSPPLRAAMVTSAYAEVSAWSRRAASAATAV